MVPWGRGGLLAAERRVCGAAWSEPLKSRSGPVRRTHVTTRARIKSQVLLSLALTIVTTGCTQPGVGCVSLCQASGCGANVGGGCYHLCGRARPSARRAQLQRYELLARERTLEHAATASSFVGVLRAHAVREVSLYETVIDATVVSTWAGSAPDESVQISLAGHDYCDPSGYQARPDQDAVAFLVAGQPGSPYKIAGFGWGYLPITESDGEPVVVGWPPPPSNLKHETALDRYRVPTWRASVRELRDAVTRALQSRDGSHAAQQGAAADVAQSGRVWH